MKEKREQALPDSVQLLHGCDYNPEQWLEHPEVLEEDLRLMKRAHINCVSLGMFSWAFLEPEEGKFALDWMEEIIGRLYENGISTILATPTGALPRWLSGKYEEVLQVNELGMRCLPGDRHNFCPSSPVMRERMRAVNERLSERLGSARGVIAWHISNEYGGNGRDASCHCPHCQRAFRAWLRARYKTLDALNRAWWTGFWSRTYTDWEQIHSPGPLGERVLHGLNLDWRRFVSDQLLSFCREEIEAVRTYSRLPVTTNMMGFFKPLNYFAWAEALDFISWDCYPYWHGEEDESKTACEASAAHSLMRSLKGRPFLMMESTPSVINWRPLNTLKRPGIHMLSCMQAVAHGSDSVQYFQWRKSRGGCEKFHGAVLDHKNGANTRVFQEVREVGERLEELSPLLCGKGKRAEIAMVFDWENWWAVEDAWAVDNGLDYRQEFFRYYRPFWELGIDVDLIDMERPLEGYRLVIAPLNYMYRGDYAERVRAFVQGGGWYVTTYWSGEADGSDLCFLQEHPLADVLGIRPEETDAPGGRWRNRVSYLGSPYDTEGLCALVHAEGAEVLAVYEKDFYKGFPALTRNRFGRGQAYYIASQNGEDFIKSFCRELLRERGISNGFAGELPRGVTCTRRGELWFLQNFNAECVSVAADGRFCEVPGVCQEEAARGEGTDGGGGQAFRLKPFSCMILARAKE